MRANKNVMRNFNIKVNEGERIILKLKILKIGKCHKYNPYEILPINTNILEDNNKDKNEYGLKIEFNRIIKVKKETSILTSL